MTRAALATSVHPTAVVDPRARLGSGVEIGPYAVIGPEVEIGDGSRIGPHVVIDGRVRLGSGNRVFPGACIGLEPQDLKYGGAPTEVVLGDDNTIRECVTINRATDEGEQTRLGSGNLLMAYSHIGHNCHLGDRIVIANGVAVAGHVVIGDRAVIGGVLSAAYLFVGRVLRPHLSLAPYGALVFLSCGLWLLRPGADPRAEWTKTSIDANSSGFEHAAILADLDENGIDELYVANDDDGEVNRYLWVDGEPLKETLYTYPAGLSGFTWNIMPAPVAVLP